MLWYGRDGWHTPHGGLVTDEALGIPAVRSRGKKALAFVVVVVVVV